MSSIALILLNYNSTELTKACIKSLMATKDPDDTYTITVLDNASTTPPSQEELGEAHLVLSKTNDGFALGNNRAVKEALKFAKQQGDSVEYLLFLNNDTRVTKGMVRTLIETFQNTKNTGIVLPKIYFEKGHEYHKGSYTQDERGKVIWYAGGGIDWPNVMLFHKGVDEVDFGQFEEATTVAFATGCCMLTTPDVWKKVGGFDPAYFLYYEDADLSMRLRHKGYQLLMEPKAILYHINAGSTDGGGSDLHQYYQTRNRLRFGLQYAVWRAKLALMKEAWSIYRSGSPSERRGVLHALEGRWGKQYQAGNQ